MQIPTSAGVLANSVLPMTPTQGASLSQVGETVGSASFAPVESVSSVSLSRNIPEQRVQPNEFTPYTKSGASISENSNFIADSQSQDSASEITSQPESNQEGESSAQSSQTNKSQSSQENQKNTDQPERSQREADQAEQQQENQEQQNLDIIRELSQRDTEVRAHEQAHKSVGGQYAGSPSYTYQKGPDGVSYAVGGEVPIDVAPLEGKPRATLEKMQTVQRAALAPAEPSSQDRRVASMAAQQASQARAEIASESRSSVSEDQPDNGVEPKINRDFAGDVQEIKPLNSGAEGSISKLYVSDTRDELPVLSDRIAKINEIIMAISQNDTANASGKLLDDVV